MSLSNALSSDDNQCRVEALWYAFHQRVHGFAVKRLPTAADADDVVQDIFLRIHKGIDGLHDGQQVQAWVFSIARRAIADFYRRRYRHVEEALGTPSDLQTPQEEPPAGHIDAYYGDHSVHEEVLSWLRPMIAALPEKYRTPLQMADVDGYTQREVAEALGLSVSGAKSRVQRARVMLGDVLQTCCEVEFGADGEAIEFRRLQR